MEDFAKKTQTRAEQRAEESKNLGRGVDISQVFVAKETGAVRVGESDVRFDGTVFDFINSKWGECEEELC